MEENAITYEVTLGGGGGESDQFSRSNYQFLWNTEAKETYWSIREDVIRKTQGWGNLQDERPNSFTE